MPGHATVRKTKMKKLHIASIFIMLPLISGCTFYKGDGKFVETTRTCVPVISITHGFTIELPTFRTTDNVKKTFYLGELPKQTDTLHIDLVTAIPTQTLTPEQEKELLNQIPKEHLIKCSLVNSETKEILAEKSLNVFDYPRMNNRKLRRAFILNLLELRPHAIPIETPLEIQFEYLINGFPLDREMLIVVLMDPPFA